MALDPNNVDVGVVHDLLAKSIADLKLPLFRSVFLLSRAEDRAALLVLLAREIATLAVIEFAEASGRGRIDAALVRAGVRTMWGTLEETGVVESTLQQYYQERKPR
jgi:hypothetical protein